MSLGDHTCTSHTNFLLRERERGIAFFGEYSGSGTVHNQVAGVVGFNTDGISFGIFPSLCGTLLGV